MTVAPARLPPEPVKLETSGKRREERSQREHKLKESSRSARDLRASADRGSPKKGTSNRRSSNSRHTKAPESNLSESGSKKESREESSSPTSEAQSPKGNRSRLEVKKLSLESLLPPSEPIRPVEMPDFSQKVFPSSPFPPSSLVSGKYPSAPPFSFLFAFSISPFFLSTLSRDSRP